MQANYRDYEFVKRLILKYNFLTQNDRDYNNFMRELAEHFLV